MNQLLVDPDNFSTHLSTYTTSVASTVIYGLRSTDNDETVANLKKVRPHVGLICRPRLLSHQHNLHLVLNKHLLIPT